MPRRRVTPRDPLEALVAAALEAAGIRYLRDSGPVRKRNPSNLDFLLPDHGVEIEVKRYHSERIAEQMSRAPNVIALQGEPAVRFFCAALAGGLA